MTEYSGPCPAYTDGCLDCAESGQCERQDTIEREDAEERRQEARDEEELWKTPVRS